MSEHLQVVRQWIQRAEADQKAAEILIGADPVILDIACFHCQQSFEKLLKAYLVYHNVDFPFTHSLELLIELCTEIDVEFTNFDVKNLTQYAVRMRYPHDSFAPENEEALYYLELTFKLKGFLFERIGLME
jgi:HEPN domain-containing protein